MAKVLALVTFKIYPPEMGGQKGVADFYEYLSKHYKVILAVSGDNRINMKNVYPLLFSNKNIIRNLTRLGRLGTLVRKHKPVAIIAEHSYPAWIAWLLSRSFTIPFIIHSHNIEALRFQKMKRRWWKVYWNYEKWIHRKADHSFFISKDDEIFAIKYFGLDPHKCSVVTYGIDEPTPFTYVEKNAGTILFFNGSLDYKPNVDAVEFIVDKLNPVLRSRLNNYRILISGKGASSELIEKISNIPEIQFLGFVKNLNAIFNKTSVFINPVLNNTGIKTKIVEAIGHHCTVVSTESGAHGMEVVHCGEKLKVVPDGDWNGFVSAIIACAKEQRKPSPDEYFHFYLWRNIAAKAAADIAVTVENHKSSHINDRI